MFGFSFRVIGLRVHAIAVSLTLILLTALLGLRANSVARQQVEETKNLLWHDLSAQSIMVKIESYLHGLEEAKRKFEVTGDSRYLALGERHESSLQSARVALSEIMESLYPGTAAQVAGIASVNDIKAFKRMVEERREKRLEKAQRSALGLQRLIMVALVMSVGITAWLILLFYRELLEPLKRIREATAKIGGGDFAARLQPMSGVAELRELSLSFNLMAERLESLEKAKSEFLATISHEIRNPLAALKEGLSLLAEHGDSLSPVARNRGFCACLIASKRLEAMINNLLSLHSGQERLFDFNVAPRLIDTAIQTAIDEVRPLADKKGMDFTLSGDLGKTAVYDRDAVVQVFENLFMNAIKYGHENSLIEVKLAEVREQSQPTSRIEIQVSSHGRQLQQVELTRIFERFYRGSNSSLHPGLGIGLHVVRKIIEAHHGGVRAETDQNGRVTFGVWMPSYDGHKSGEEARA